MNDSGGLWAAAIVHSPLQRATLIAIGHAQAQLV